MKLVSKSDIFFTLVICAVSLLIFFVFAAREEGTSVIITLKGEVIAEYDLKEDREFSVEGEYKNDIVIKDNKIFVKSSDCGNKACVKQGSISKSGQSIVCAPNGTVITIKGESGVDGISQ